MTAMKIGPIDETKVGTEAKRLAGCFHLVADRTREDSLVVEAKKIFEAAAVGGKIPAFNADEREYLSRALLEAAQRDVTVRYATPRDRATTAQTFVTTAHKIGLF